MDDRWVVRTDDRGDDDPSFGEEVARDAAHGSHQARPPRRTPPPAVVPVVIDEETDSLVVVEVQVHRRPKLAGRSGPVLNFYIYPATDVDLLGRTAAGGDDPDALQTRHVIARRGGLVGPFPRARSPGTRFQVALDGLVGRAVDHDPAAIEQDGPIAQPQDRRHAVRDEDDRPAPFADLRHLAQTLLLELGVADRKDLVDEKDLRLQEGGHGEAEPYLHAARVALDRCVQELADICEGNDLVEPTQNLRPLHAQDGPAEEDVVSAGELLVKAGPDLEQRPNASVQLRAAQCRLGDARHDLEQGGLAGAISADHPDDRAARHLEGDIPEGPEVVASVLAPGPPERVRDRIPECLCETAVRIPT